MREVEEIGGLLRLLFVCLGRPGCRMGEARSVAVGAVGPVPGWLSTALSCDQPPQEVRVKVSTPVLCALRRRLGSPSLVGTAPGECGAWLARLLASVLVVWNTEELDLPWF